MTEIKQTDEVAKHDLDLKYNKEMLAMIFLAIRQWIIIIAAFTSGTTITAEVLLKFFGG
jgi:hypothetical protein